MYCNIDCFDQINDSSMCDFIQLIRVTSWSHIHVLNSIDELVYNPNDSFMSKTLINQTKIAPLVSGHIPYYKYHSRPLTRRASCKSVTVFLIDWQADEIARTLCVNKKKSATITIIIINNIGTIDQKASRKRVIHNIYSIPYVLPIKSWWFIRHRAE